MNSIGVDYDQLHCSLALWEACDGTPVLRVVSDGARTLIPTAVAMGGDGSLAWGSKAVVAPPPGSIQKRGSLTEVGPWLSSPVTSDFAKGVFQHLKMHLGRVEPTKRNGYETVVAALARKEATSQQVTTLFAGAGFSEVLLIDPCEALLCRWMGERMGNPAGRDRLPQRVLTVWIGDTGTACGAFQLGTEDGGTIRAESACLPNRCLAAGHGHMTARLREMIADRAGGLSETEEIAVEDAILEFATRLGKASPEEPVEWRGATASRLFTNLRIRRREVELWPEAVLWKSELPSLAEAAAKGLEGTGALELAIFGGIGGIWSCAQGALEEICHVFSMPEPWVAVASGAAIRPLFELATANILNEKASGTSSVKTALSSLSLKHTSGPRPPWERG